MRMLVAERLPLLAALVLAPGCYYAELAGRQLELVNDQRPVPAALRSEMDVDRRRLLELVPDLRSFARHTMQLPVGRSYAGYYATEARGIAFVLVASERTRLCAYTWWFPVVGEVAYKSFVHETDARAEQSELERKGYDTFVGRVTAYSTLGFFRDPVTTVMMRKGLVPFVEVMLHEMSHARLYVPGHTDWNEQLASLSGRIGAEQYLKARFSGDAHVMQQLLQRKRRREQLDAAVLATLGALERLYASGRPEPYLLRARQQPFAQLERELARLYPEDDPEERVINNAHLLQYRRYLSGADELEQLWVAARGSWQRFWRLAEQRGREL
jgi:predicted aminopeptidase